MPTIQSACTGNCNQGRACTCTREPIDQDDLPREPLTVLEAAGLVGIVLASAGAVVMLVLSMVL